MKNILVSGYIGFNNFGDEAIFYALSNHLKKLGYNVSALCNNKDSVQKKYDVKTYYFKNPKEILQAISNCDILISGGGSLLQNKTSNFSLFYYLFIIFLAKLFFKKVIIFAQGIEPIKGKFPSLITKIILKMVNFISVRDEKSQKLLSKWNINSTLVSDPAYSLVENHKINENKKGLLIQLRDFKNINDEFISNLANTITSTYDKEIDVMSFQDEIDEKKCLDLIEEFKKLNVKANYISSKDINSTIDIINSKEFVISTRLHGLIISSALKSNTFALIYDDKIKTLVEELNLDFIDIKNYSQEELSNKFKEFFNEKSKKEYYYRKFSFDIIDKELK